MHSNYPTHIRLPMKKGQKININCMYNFALIKHTYYVIIHKFKKGIISILNATRNPINYGVFHSVKGNTKVL